MGNSLAQSSASSSPSPKHEIKYLDLVQMDINSFNESQNEKRELFKKKKGIEAYFEQMQSNKHNSLKESRSVDYRLTDDELNRLKRNGYIVKQINNNNKTFARKLLELYNNDMPVFITSDMILHAFHKFYDETLMDIEVDMYNKLIELCKELLETIMSIDSQNCTLNRILKELLPLFEAPLYIINDVRKNIYDDEIKRTEEHKKITEKLIKKYSLSLSDEKKLENINRVLKSGGFEKLKHLEEISDIHGSKETLEMVEKISKYSDISMKINNISINMMGTQFKPRGHYTKSKKMECYFKIFTLFSNSNVILKYLDDNYLDSIMLASIISRICGQSLPSIRIFYNFIEKIVGEADGFNVESFNEFLDTLLPTNLSLVGELEYIVANIIMIGNKFKEYLDNNKKYICKYNKFGESLPLFKEIKSSFSIIGKGSTYDNYVISQMVDENFITNDNVRPKRKFLEIMEVMYCAFGNPSAYNDLNNNMKEPQKYNNHLNKIQDEVTDIINTTVPKTIYQQQLLLLRSLTKDKKLLEDIDWLPFYTNEWCKKQLNTQLGHYNEMRHDNVLYLDEICGCCCLCRHPDLLVEPVPSFWKEFLKLIDMMDSLLPNNKCLKNYRKYIGHFIEFLDYQLSGKQPPDDLIELLKGIVSEHHMGSGGDTYLRGWYISLFKSSDDAEKYSPETSSYFTAVPDDRGEGGILNLGTGEVQTLYVLSNDPFTHEQKIFLGPVYSSYSFKTDYDDRLNDENWKNRIKNYKPFDCNCN